MKRSIVQCSAVLLLCVVQCSAIVVPVSRYYVAIASIKYYNIFATQLQQIVSYKSKMIF